MSINELEQAIQRVCLAETPDQPCLAQLGNDAVFRDYRRMVRRRLLTELRSALPRTASTVGQAFFDQAFERFLCEFPPTTRFFYGLAQQFCTAMLPHFEAALAAYQIPGHAADLLQYESTRRVVANLPDQLSAAIVTQLQEFDFDHPVVLEPTHRLLRLNHGVHSIQEAYPSGPTFLVLFRPNDDSHVKYFRVDPTTFDLLALLNKRPLSMTAALQVIGKQRKLNIDQAYLEGLCGVLADFIEHGLLRGVRSPSPTPPAAEHT